MARKNHTDEFRRQAVDLYESTPGATGYGIAEDLGIERGTLRHSSPWTWCTRLRILRARMAQAHWPLDQRMRRPSPGDRPHC